MGSRLEWAVQTGQFNHWGKTRNRKWIKPDITSFTIQSHFGLETKLYNLFQTAHNTGSQTGPQTFQSEWSLHMSTLPLKITYKSTITFFFPEYRMISRCHEKMLTGNRFTRLWKIKMPIWQTAWKTWWWEKMVMTALTILIFISSLLLKFSWKTWVLQSTHPTSCSLETSWWAEHSWVFPSSLLCKSYSKIDFRDLPDSPVAKTLHSQCRGARFDPWPGN